MILEHISYKELVIPTISNRLNPIICKPIELMQGVATLRPGQADFIFLDLPRASANGAVELYAANDDGSVSMRSFSLDDSDYQTTLTSNFMVIARLARQSLSPRGVLAFTSNWQHYLVARATFDSTFSSRNCLGELVYQTREGGGNDSRYMSIDHESLLFYAVAPANVNPFRIPKSDDELKKYNQEDEYGKYTWDTFIRKQAKMYYPIECPDGSVLEFDDDGNRISWLRGKTRFEDDLKRGEVKFEKVGGHYKLYYKDRVKELKILRSIALAKNNGDEVFEDLTSESSFKDLLTKHGSAELKNTDIPYAKGSRFFRLVFDAVASDAELILVPFPEFGSAALGLLSSRSKGSLITAVSPDRSSIWEDRLSDSLDSSKPKEPEFLSLAGLLTGTNYSEKAEIYASSLLCRFNAPVSVTQNVFSSTAVEGSIGWFCIESKMYAVYVGDQQAIEITFDSLLQEEQQLCSSEEVVIFSTCDLPEIIPPKFSGLVTSEILPETHVC